MIWWWYDDHRQLPGFLYHSPRHSAEQCGLGLRLRNDPVGQAGGDTAGCSWESRQSCVVHAVAVQLPAAEAREGWGLSGCCAGTASRTGPRARWEGKDEETCSSYTEQGWNDWNVDRSWTGKLKLVDVSWDVLIRKLCARNLCTFVKQQNLELFSESQAPAVCSKASAVSLFDFLPDSHFLLWHRRACLM